MGNSLPSDMMLCVISYWVLSGAKWRQIQQLCCCAFPAKLLKRRDVYIKGWQARKTAKRYPKYGVQKGWERVTSPETGAENFSEITDAEAKQLGFPF